MTKKNSENKRVLGVWRYHKTIQCIQSFGHPTLWGFTRHCPFLFFKNALESAMGKLNTSLACRGMRNASEM